jgi:hypothetical protein
MGTQRLLLNRVVVVKPWRKHGNGAKGGGRQGTSGKKGTIFQLENGTQTELKTETGSTFTDLSRKLRSSGLIPQHVALNKSGETRF